MDCFFYQGEIDSDRKNQNGEHQKESTNYGATYVVVVWRCTTPSSLVVVRVVVSGTVVTTGGAEYTTGGGYSELYCVTVFFSTVPLLK